MVLPGHRELGTEPRALDGSVDICVSRRPAHSPRRTTGGSEQIALTCRRPEQPGAVVAGSLWLLEAYRCGG